MIRVQMFQRRVQTHLKVLDEQNQGPHETNLVWFGEEAGGQHGVLGGLQAVGGALGHDDVHGHVTHRVQFLLGTERNIGARLGTGNGPERSNATSLVLGSAGAWASLVCLIFSTIFLMKAWLLFSFLAMMISRTNHRALPAETEDKVKPREGTRRGAAPPQAGPTL